MIARIVGPLVLGTASGLAIAAANQSSSAFVAVGSFVAFYVFFVLATWIGMRAGLAWWLVSLVGAPVGLLVGIMVTLLTNTASFCFLGPCPTPKPFPFGVLFTVNFGVLGLAQAFTLSGASRKLLWIVGNLVAGAAFGFAIQLSTSVLHQNDQIVGYVPGTIGGLAWGIVMVGLIAYGRVST